MITACAFRKRILLYQGGLSLVSQVAEWVDGNADYALLRIPVCPAAQLERIVDPCTSFILDATRAPQEVYRVLSELDPELMRACAAVYTEKAQFELERVVRGVGVPYLDGPLSLDEWNRVLRWRHAIDDGGSAGINGSVLLLWQVHDSVPV